MKKRIMVIALIGVLAFVLAGVGVLAHYHTRDPAISEEEAKSISNFIKLGMPIRPAVFIYILVIAFGYESFFPEEKLPANSLFFLG